MMRDHPLKAWRQDGRLSQEEAASKLGITRWTVNAIETGRRQPSFPLVAKIETLTGIPRHELRPDVFGPATPSNPQAAA